MKVYKIYNKKIDMFAASGTDDWYHKIGKVWNNLKNLKLHLREITKQGEWSSRFKSYISDCELITYEIIEVDRRPMSMILNWYKEDQNMKEIEESRLNFERAKKERKKQFLELQKEFAE